MNLQDEAQKHARGCPWPRGVCSCGRLKVRPHPLDRAARAEAVLRELLDLSTHVTFGIPPPGWHELIHKAGAVLMAAERGENR